MIRKRKSGIENNKADGESEAAEDSYTQMSTMNSEYAHSENDSDNNLESIESLSDVDDAERTESFGSRLYTVKQINYFLD